MKRTPAILLTLLFFACAVVLPLLHHGSNHGRRMGHVRGHHQIASLRSIMQLIDAPLLFAEEQIVTCASISGYTYINTSPRLMFAALPGGAAQARAPPHT